jgi:hypothetical protein
MMAPTKHAILIVSAAMLVFAFHSTSCAQGADHIYIRGEKYRVAPDCEIREMGFEVRDVRFFENSAADYLNAINSYKDLPRDLRGQSDYALRNEWLPEFKELEQWINDNEPTFKELNNAATKPFFVFPILKEKDAPVFGILLPHLRYLRDMAPMLSVRAKLALSRGQFNIALESWRNCLVMSEHVSQDPYIISGLVAAAARSIGSRAIQDTVLRRDLTLLQLQDTIKMLQPFVEKPLRFGSAMRSEQIFGVQGMKEIFQILQTDHAWSDLDNLFDGDFLTKAVFRLGRITPVPRIVFQTNLREFYQELNRVFSLPLPEFMRFLNESESEDAPPQEIKLWGPAKLLGSTVYKVRIQDAKSELGMNALILTVALQTYKKQHKQYPQTLADLQSILDPIPKDPFTGMDFIYAQNENGYVFYSVGQDLKDDQGVGKRYEGPDVVFTNKVEPYKPYTPPDK